MRLAVLLVLLAALVPAADHPPGFVQAVEFPYYLYPQPLWERELVWLKNLGIDTVVFSIPWNWHHIDGESDLTGRTSPRRDLVGFVRLLKRVGLRAWIRPVSPVKNWIGGGLYPGGENDRTAWLRELEKTLAPQLAIHDGPIQLVEGGGGILQAASPPEPVTHVSIIDATALARSRDAMAQGHGSLIWENVEDAVTPPGWEAAGGPLFQRGAISLTGDERANVAALRRGALLMKYWGATLDAMRPRPVHLSIGRLPPGVTARQLVVPEGPSAISLINQSSKPFQGQFRTYYPALKRSLVLPAIQLAPADALWLPVNVPISDAAFCRECSTFPKGDHIIYATAELTTTEYENGILAMEFHAPAAGEVLLQLSRQPTGPFLAAGHPMEFDWDEKTLRARLPIPAGKAPGFRVRIGLAMQPPDASGFFVNAHRLILGETNHLAASFSSPEVAERSRLRLPENYRATQTSRTPGEMEYEIHVPPAAMHGEWADLGLEADGVLLSRARLQLLRPVSLRVRESLSLHFGSQAELPVAPPVVSLEPASGRNLTVTILNNFPEIRNYVLEAQGEGYRFFPPRAEISIGAGMERDVDLRVFVEDSESAVRRAGLRPWRLRLTGSATVELPMRFAVIPRGQAVAYSMDLDGDGYPEFVLENQRIRAVFTAQDGGRWLEFLWKDSGLNLLPADGALAGRGGVRVFMENEGSEARLILQAKDWRRVVRLGGIAAEMAVEQNSPLPTEGLHTEKRNDVIFRVTSESPQLAKYAVERGEPPTSGR